MALLRKNVRECKMLTHCKNRTEKHSMMHVIRKSANQQSSK